MIIILTSNEVVDSITLYFFIGCIQGAPAVLRQAAQGVLRQRRRRGVLLRQPAAGEQQREPGHAQRQTQEDLWHRLGRGLFSGAIFSWFCYAGL